MSHFYIFSFIFFDFFNYVKQKHYGSSLYCEVMVYEAIFSLLFHPSGSTAMQLNPSVPASDFVDPSEVKNLIQLKGYFRGSSSAWNDVLENVLHHDVGLCALGGLISHLSRMMVYLLSCLLLLSIP